MFKVEKVKVFKTKYLKLQEGLVWKWKISCKEVAGWILEP